MPRCSCLPSPPWAQHNAWQEVAESLVGGAERAEEISSPSVPPHCPHSPGRQSERPSFSLTSGSLENKNRRHLPSDR